MTKRDTIANSPDDAGLAYHALRDLTRGHTWRDSTIAVAAVVCMWADDAGLDPATHDEFVTVFCGLMRTGLRAAREWEEPL